MERERRLLYAERTHCRTVIVSITHDAEEAAAAADDMVRFSGELNGGRPLRCAGLPSSLSVSDGPISLVFRDADQDGDFEGEETRTQTTWTVLDPADTDGAPMYDTELDQYVFNFRFDGNVGGARVAMQTAAPLLIDSLPSVVFGPVAGRRAPYTATFAENSGAPLMVPITVSQLPQSSTSFSFTIGGTATSGTDYRAPSSTSVSFAPGDPQTKHVSITPIDDSDVEADETIILSFAAPQTDDGYRRRNMATLTLTSEDAPTTPVVRPMPPVVRPMPPVSGTMPTLSLAASTNTVAEGTSTLSLVLNLGSALSQAGSVRVSATAGTATAGSDYTAPAATLALPAGQTRITLDVSILDDSLAEQDEDFTVSLTAVGSAYTLGTVSSTTITITDDETPSIAIGTAATSSAAFTATHAEADGAVTVPVTVSHAPGSTVAFPLTIGGTATSGQDYMALDASISFSPGDSLSKNITISLIDDNAAESDETLTLMLGNSATGTLGARYTRNNSSATLTITSEDADSMPTFGSASVTAQVYMVNTRTSVRLPAATSGDAPLVYSVTPALPNGLLFSGVSRRLRGTPTTASAITTYTYTVTDADGDTDTLTFSITVEAAVTTMGLGVPALQSVPVLSSISGRQP